ncbi:hypothetical protein [Pseudophaeobacter sp.]|uniref:hypothetical protein n=1 Tax=Pseudophaeobacter sp. TaxID=1971739 RepID=UPI004057F413
MKSITLAAVLAMTSPAYAQLVTDLSCVRMNTVFETTTADSTHQQIHFSGSAIAYKMLIKGYGLARGAINHQSNFEKILVLCRLRPESSVDELLEELNWNGLRGRYLSASKK